MRHLEGSLEIHLLPVSTQISHLTSQALNLGRALGMCPVGSSTAHSPHSNDPWPKSAHLSSATSRHYAHQKVPKVLQLEWKPSSLPLEAGGRSVGRGCGCFTCRNTLRPPNLNIPILQMEKLMHKQLSPKSPSHKVTMVTYLGSSGPHIDSSNHPGERVTQALVPSKGGRCCLTPTQQHSTG